jgi:hypothetical protein
LQHPLGVTYHDGWLYVADTYNNKIKRVSPKEQTSATFAGTGAGGLADGERAMFDEPAGVSGALGKLYVADTNNHAIRIVDLKTKRTDTLQIKGLDKLRLRAISKRFAGETIELPAQTVEPGDATLTLNLELPKGYKLNALAPSSVVVASVSGADQVIRNPQFPITARLKLSEGDATVKADFVIYYCESEKESLCYFKEAVVSVPVKVKLGAGSRVLTATYRLQLANDQ